MFYEIDVLGAFVPALALWFVVALAVFVAADALLTAARVYRLFWYTPLVRLALFIYFFCGIAMIANMFLQIPALALTISTLVIVVFSLFLLYDLQRIIRGGETNYVIATTGVYMSLFNIFANLLNLLLALAGERE